MNTATPRLFVAATQQNDGKTTTSLGLFGALQKRFPRIGYIKPVGQRFVEIDGAKVDEDSVLMDQTYHVHTPMEAMSPISIEPDFTRKYIENANLDFFVNRLFAAFDRASWEKDFVIIEGSGHAGVGSVFDLSNARVAKLLESKALLVTKGGIGRAIDEAALNKALFDKEGVELIGVVLNKVMPDKIDFIRDIVGRGLKRLGIELLGVIPTEPMLTNPTLGQVRKEIGGRFLSGEQFYRRRLKKVIIGAMMPEHVVQFFRPGMLIVTPGDRTDILQTALEANASPEFAGVMTIGGIALSGDLLPDESMIRKLAESHLPVIASPLDSYSVVSRIHSMTVKTLPGDYEKIEKIQSLIEQHIDVDRLMTALLR